MPYLFIIDNKNKSSANPLLLVCTFLLLALLNAQVQAKDVSSRLINWSSDAGIERFERAIKTDFFKLANHFESQNNKIYCGVASSVIVLNALRVRNGAKENRLPLADSVLSDEDRQYIPKIFSPYFDRYTQDNVFVENSKSKLEVLGKPLKQPGSDKKDRDIGFQLWQLQDLLEQHGLKVMKKVASETHTLEGFRQDVKQNLATKDDYILVNYTRKTLQQKGGGHISPLGAYDESSDSVLIMDVNSNKADWLWVPLDLLYASMATFDTIENRGYLLISEK